MSGSVLENAGTGASGATLGIGGYLAWIETNTAALGVIIMAITMVMTGLFYWARIKLMQRELEIQEGKTEEALVDRFYEEIAAMESGGKDKAEARAILKTLMDRRND